MQSIRFYKQDTVNVLRQNIMANLTWYQAEGNIDTPDILAEHKEMSKKIDPVCWEQLNQSPDENKDVQNAIVVYKGLDLSPQQAADERIWVYATHRIARNYVIKRWPRIPTDKDKAKKYILSHYFVSGARGLIRDNAVARLWWMGHVANRCKDYDLETTLKILLRDSDVRANLLERSSVSMSQEMFNGVIRLLGRSLDTSDEPAIYKRSNFRALMKMLNRRGGRIMLNVLSPQQLDDMLNELAKQAIKNNDANSSGV